ITANGGITGSTASFHYLTSLQQATLQNGWGGSSTNGVVYGANGNVAFQSAATNSNWWTLFGTNGAGMFNVYNQTAASTGSKVSTYHNTLDDGSGASTWAGL